MKWISGHISDFNQEEYDEAYRSLSLSRKLRIDRCKREEDRIRSLLGEMLLKKLLCEYTKKEITLESEANGRPVLKDSELFVSISHSGEMAACAVDEKPIGIDVQGIKPIKSKLICRVCTKEEEEYVLASAAGATGEMIYDQPTLERFYEIWTAKEAYFKKVGTGITDFKSVNVLSLKRSVYRVGEYMIQMV